MKKIIATSLIFAALAVVPAVHAETVECKTTQYGGAVCGVETTTETKVEHLAPTGLDDMSFAQMVSVLGIVAVAATVMYKLTYRSYILG